MNRPTVDVLLPVRAPAPWLPQTLTSLTRQTVGDWRVVVVLDGRSKAIEEHVRAMGPRAQLISVANSPGLVAQLNLGLDACDAEFVARIDADDLALPTRLRQQVAFLRNHPDHVTVGSWAWLIDGSGRRIGSRGGPEASVRRKLRWRNALIHPSTMSRLNAVREVGGYRPQAKNVEDYDLWLRLAARGQIGVLQEYLIEYRIHDAQVTQSFHLSKPARQAVREARVALARAEGRSVAAAHVRQAAWTLALVGKGATRSIR